MQTLEQAALEVYLETACYLNYKYSVWIRLRNVGLTSVALQLSPSISLSLPTEVDQDLYLVS